MALLDVLWKVSLQAGVLALLVLLVSRLSRRAPASWRHALWLVVVVKFLVPPFAYCPADLVPQRLKPRATAQQSPPARTVTDRSGSVIPDASPRISDPVASDNSKPLVSGSQTRGDRSGITDPQPSAPSLIVALWLAGVAGAAGLLGMRYRRQVSLVRASTEAGPELAALLADCVTRLSARRTPRLMVSHAVGTPILIGAIHPTILLPRDITASCDRGDLAAMLLHEIAHVKRRDIAWMWLQQIAQVLFFFHPCVWLAGREMKRERELACDEMVLATSGISPKEYASGYVSALKLANGESGFAGALGMAEPFDMEKRRLRAILDQRVPRLTRRWAAALVILAAIGLPTFAGVSRSKQHTGRELLTQVTQSRAKAAASMRSGKGTVYYPGYSKQHSGMRPTKASVAFSGERFAVRQPGGTDAFWDGKTMVLREQGRRPVSFRTESQMQFAANSYRRLFSVLDQAYPDLTKVLLYHKGEPKVVGHEMVNGARCTIVESVQEFKEKGGGSHSDIRRLWIDPAKDYVVPRVRVWSQKGAGPKVLLSETDVVFREYGSVWGPAKYVHDEYRNGEPYAGQTMTYAPDFRLNVKVTEADLKPDGAAAPSPAPSSPTDAEVMAGLTAVQGPGVVVTLRDSPRRIDPKEKRAEVISSYLVHDTDVRAVVNELFAAGAEAVSVNGQRIVANSSIRAVGPVLMVNSVKIAAPYAIGAIGRPDVLEKALKMPAGPADSLAVLDMIQIAKKSSVLVPAFAGKPHFDLAKPVAGSQRTALPVPEDQKRAQLQEIERSKQLTEKALDDLEAKSREVEARIKAREKTQAAPEPRPEASTGGFEMPVKGRITGQYGYRVHPITKVYKLHTGIDIACPTGTPVNAAAGGTVILAKWMGAYGNAVVIDHGDGVSTLYGHNSSLAVKPGDRVSKGQPIAESGSTGYSTGPQCHFEKRVNGTPVKPI